MLLLLGAATQAHAESSSLAFFKKDDALTVFGENVRMKVPRLQEPKLEKKDAPSAPDEKAPANVQMTSAAILEKYGDPSADVPLRVQPDAPKPFQAAIEAINAGNPELAERYFGQYLAYMNKLKGLGQAVTEWTGRNQQKEMIETYLQPDAGNGPTAQAIRDMLGFKTANAFAINTNRDLRDRTALRSAITESLGEIDNKRHLVNVYYFFDPSEAVSRLMAQELEKVQRERRKDDRIRIIGLTTRVPLTKEIESLQAELKLTFPIQDGTKFAEQFGITGGPVTVYAVPGFEQAGKDSGFRTFEFLDEMVGVIQGKV